MENDKNGRKRREPSARGNQPLQKQLKVIVWICVEPPAMRPVCSAEGVSLTDGEAQAALTAGFSSVCSMVSGHAVLHAGTALAWPKIKHRVDTIRTHGVSVTVHDRSPTVD